MVLKMQIKFFEHDEHTSQLILFRISTNDGMTFCTLDFKFPLVWREKWKSFSLGYIGAEIDKEVKRFIDEAYSKAEKLLKDNINKLHAVAQALLEKEKIDREEFLQIFDAA